MENRKSFLWVGIVCLVSLVCNILALDSFFGLLPFWSGSEGMVSTFQIEQVRRVTSTIGLFSLFALYYFFSGWNYYFFWWVGRVRQKPYRDIKFLNISWVLPIVNVFYPQYKMFNAIRKLDHLFRQNKLGFPVITYALFFLTWIVWPVYLFYRIGAKYAYLYLDINAYSFILKLFFDEEASLSMSYLYLNDASVFAINFLSLLWIPLFLLLVFVLQRILEKGQNTLPDTMTHKVDRFGEK